MVKKETIFYIALVVLVLAVAYLLYSNFQLQKMLAPISGQQQNPQMLPATPIGIGTGGITTLDITGPAEDVGENSVSLHDPEGNLVTINISNDTIISRQGEEKSQKVFQQELAAYDAKLKELLKDPEKNRKELEALKYPSETTITPAALSEIQIGDRISVTADIRNLNIALRIFVYQQEAQ